MALSHELRSLRPDYDMHAGSLAYSAHTMMPSADEFRITIKGKASHGSTPYLGVSAASAAANIVVALQQLISLEIPCDEPVILSIGKLTSGTASNIIPEEAEIMGSFRAFTRENREYLRRRLPEVATSIAESCRANAKASFWAALLRTSTIPIWQKKWQATAARSWKRYR